MAEHETSRRWPLARALLRLGLGLGICGLLSWWLAPTPHELEQMTRFDARFAAVSLAGTALAVLTTAARWRLLHQTLAAERLPFRVYVHAITSTRLAGQLSSVLLADLLGRGILLRAGGSKQGLGRLATPVVLERLIDFILPLGFFGWMFGVRLLAWPPWPAVAALTIGITVTLGPLLRPACLLAARAQAWLGRRSLDAPQSRVELSLRRAYLMVLLGVGRFAAVLLQFFGAGAALGILLPPDSLLGATAVAQLGALVGITPGSLGFVEAGWTAGLRWYGHSDGAIVVFALAARLFMVVNFAILTLATWLWTRRVAARDGTRA